MAEAINEMERSSRNQTRMPARTRRPKTQAATTLGETSRETPPHITGTEENG